VNPLTLLRFKSTELRALRGSPRTVLASERHDGDGHVGGAAAEAVAEGEAGGTADDVDGPLLLKLAT